MHASGERTRWIGAWLGIAGAAIGAGCGGPAPADDAGALPIDARTEVDAIAELDAPIGDADVPPVDSGGPVRGPLVSTAEPPVGCAPSPGMPLDPSCVAPDLGCLGVRVAPTPGAPIPVTARFGEAVGDSPLRAGAPVDFYASNVFTDTCAPPACTTSAADSMGDVRATLPAGGWFAYRVREGAATPSSEPVTTIGVGRVAPDAPGTSAEVFVSRSTIGLIPALYSRMRVPGTSIVSGAVYDCQGRAIANARVRVYAGAAEIPAGTMSTSPFVGYFNGSAPCARCMVTDSVGGRFAWANVPASAGGIRLEVEVDGAGGAPEVIACEEVPAIGDAVVIATLDPLRADYPAGSGCGG